MIRKPWLVLFSIIATLHLLVGCTTTEPTDAARSNLKRKIALQKHLNRLNRENQQLQQMLTDASSVNIETYQVLDSDFVTKERIPEFNRILERFKAINLDTQVALQALENEIKSDQQKNINIAKMLDGIVPDNSDQQQRKERLLSYMEGSGQKPSLAIYDRMHLGLAIQGVRGDVVAKYGSTDSRFTVQGTSSSLYFTYVGEYNTLIGFQHSVLAGEVLEDSSNSNNSGQKNFLQSTINSLSIGSRIESVRAFNILPQIVFGMGKTKTYSCESLDCDPIAYGISDSKLIGLELPLYQQLSSVFSWGIKFSGYNIMSEDIEYYILGQKVLEEKGSSTLLVGGVGVMVGAAW